MKDKVISKALAQLQDPCKAVRSTPVTFRATVGFKSFDQQETEPPGEKVTDLSFAEAFQDVALKIMAEAMLLMKEGVLPDNLRKQHMAKVEKLYVKYFDPII